MAYVTAKEVTAEAALRAKKLALEMAKIMEDNFILPFNPVLHERLLFIRSEFRELGFYSDCNLEFDAQKLSLSVRVTIYVLKEPKEVS